MKKFIILLAILNLSISVKGFSFYAPEKEDIEVVFNDKLDKTALDSIQKLMLDKGIILEYKELIFDDNGKLKHIFFSVYCPKDDMRGSFKTAPNSFLRKVGFRIRYNEKGEAHLHVGSLN